ncbi:MAG: hypothetical protein ACHQ51_01500 [Elusimicrobiota bacterium]
MTCMRARLTASLCLLLAAGPAKAATSVGTEAAGEIHVSGQTVPLASPIAVPPLLFAPSPGALTPSAALPPTLAPSALAAPLLAPETLRSGQNAPPPLPRSPMARQENSVSFPAGAAASKEDAAPGDDQASPSDEELTAAGRTRFDLAGEGAKEDEPGPAESVDALKSSAESTFDLWLKETDPAERKRLTKVFFKLGDKLRKEIRRSEADPARREALQAVKDGVWESRRIAIALAKTGEFVEMTGLALTRSRKREASELLLKMTGKDQTQAAGIANLLSPLIENDSANVSAGFDDLFRAQLWFADLSARESQDEIEYAETITAGGHARYQIEAAEARRRGEIIPTDGATQRMRRQTRNTCTYNAVCNLFGAEIAAGRLQSKDVLSEAVKRNPRFAARSGDDGLDARGLTSGEVSQVVHDLAQRLGKRAVTVPPGDLIRFMRTHGTPVLVAITSRSGGHALVVGNPFVAHEAEGGRKVVFETYDANYPRGMAGYIEAGQLARLMTQRFPMQPPNTAVAVVDPAP